jgi:hypothetical protein
VYEYLKIRNKLQDMSFYFRLAIAILVSIGIHIILLNWTMHHASVRNADDHGLLQVLLPKYTIDHGGQNILQSDEIPSLSPTKKATKQVRKAAEMAKPSTVAPEGRQTMGHFHWQSPPANQQYQFMNAMQQAQFAHQHELRVAAVTAELSNLAEQLRPVLYRRIVCSLLVDNEVDCIPTPNEQERPLLIQFFSLAEEAHRLSSVNPVNMELGTDVGVSFNLLITGN